MYVEAFIDGACRNEGVFGGKRKAACAVNVYYKKKEKVRFTRLLGELDHNQAEYEALITALLILTMSDFKDPTIYSDSAIVVNQVNGKWKIKSEKLVPYYLSVMEIAAEYNFKLVQVPRSKVFIPDELCNQMLDKEEDFYEQLRV